MVTHWTTLEELHGDPEVARLKGEEFHEKPETYFAQENGKNGNLLTEAAGFVELAVINNEEAKSGISRRDFLKLSGAAMVFATAGCGLRPATKIVPYVKAPEEVIPGVANYYASTMAGAEGLGVLVKTREGRPIKIEGNPDHPLTQGKLSVRGQHSIFNLYDPDRLTGPVKVTRGRLAEAATLGFSLADEEIGKALRAAQGQVVLLTGTVHGPARERLIKDFVGGFPGARHVMYDAWNHDVTRCAQEKCYGTKVLPRYRFERAEYCLMLNADPLGGGYSSLEWNIGYGKNRKVRDGKYSKWVAFESHVSHTGSNCDERFRVRADGVIKAAMAIANETAGLHGPKTFPNPGGAQPSTASVEEELKLKPGTLRRIAAELWANRGKGIVMAAEDENLQVVANYLNSICQNEGKTIDGTVSPSKQSLGSTADMLDLVTDMRAGKVEVLIVCGTNPAYSLPPSVGFAEAMSKVKTVVSLSDRVDETALLGDYVLPSTHWLESWGDAEPQVGVLSLQQPTILPLYDNRAWEDSIISLSKAAQAGTLGKFEGGWHEYLMDTWTTQIHGTRGFEAVFADFWNSALRDGVLNFVPDHDSPREFRQEALASIRVTDRSSQDLELVVHPSPILGDGMEANNAWLLETPDPVSKVVWLNPASISPATANKLGVKQGDVIQIEVQGVKAENQVFIQPGMADGVIGMASGWGRTHAGRVSQDVGVNTFAFTGLEGRTLITAGIPCAVSRTGEWAKMPCVMGHDYIEGRPIIFEASFADYQNNPSAGIHGHHFPGAGHEEHENGHTNDDSRGDLRFYTGGISDTLGRSDQDENIPINEPPSLWPEYKYEGYRWGMAIDLSSCSGCSACIAACQVENNIPVVGLDQIHRGREMHWIRIDRYYSGDPDNPDFVHQPMLCQHCENAPCETVCPVLATVHNEEGLNLQIYNRCVGTRYCSNNCPYKVRRFNWYESSFMAYGEHPLELALNPDVTVREKGIMEKCTFCIQRIRDAKGNAKRFGRKVRDGDLKTACQQTCPTDAIMFGDFNDSESDVAVAMRNERGYHVLEELNTRPSIVYWTKLRNREADPTHEESHA